MDKATEMMETIAQGALEEKKSTPIPKPKSYYTSNHNRPHNQTKNRAARKARKTNRKAN